MEGFNSELPLVVLNLCLESDSYVDVFVRVKLKVRNMHCFLRLADQMFDDKHPIWDNLRDLIRSFSIWAESLERFWGSATATTTQSLLSNFAAERFSLAFLLLLALELLTEVLTFLSISSRYFLTPFMYSLNSPSDIVPDFVCIGIKYKRQRDESVEACHDLERVTICSRRRRQMIQNRLDHRK